MYRSIVGFYIYMYMVLLVGSMTVHFLYMQNQQKHGFILTTETKVSAAKVSCGPGSSGSGTTRLVHLY